MYMHVSCIMTYRLRDQITNTGLSVLKKIIKIFLAIYPEYKLKNSIFNVRTDRHFELRNSFATNNQRIFYIFRTTLILHL